MISGQTYPSPPHPLYVFSCSLTDTPSPRNIAAVPTHNSSSPHICDSGNMFTCIKPGQHLAHILWSVIFTSIAPAHFLLPPSTKQSKLYWWNEGPVLNLGIAIAWDGSDGRREVSSLIPSPRKFS